MSYWELVNLITVGRTPPQLQTLPPPRHPPQTLQDHSCSITSLHHPEGMLPTITTHGSTILLLKLSNSLSLFIQQAEIRANAGGTCKWWQLTGLNKESVGYPAALLTLPPCAQQKAPHVSLAWPLSMVLNCSYAGYTLQYRMWHPAGAPTFLDHAAQPPRGYPNLVQFL